MMVPLSIPLMGTGDWQYAIQQRVGPQDIR